MMKLFSMLESYCYKRNIDSSPFIEMFYLFCVSCDEYNLDTISKIKRFHIKLYCYLIEQYCEKNNKKVQEINPDVLLIIFYLVIIHIVEEDITIRTTFVGKGSEKDVLRINDQLFTYIFRVNNNNSIVKNFWKTLC